MEEEKPTPITLTGTSLPFVLIGPAGKHRRVLVKSVEDTLDLIGLDGLPEHFQRDRPYILNLVMQGFGRKQRGRRNIVRSRETVAVGNGDTRTTFYSFAWRGLATTYDCEKIGDQLSRVSKELEDALAGKRIDEVEFALASVVLLCERIHEKMMRTTNLMKNLSILVVLLYGGLALYLLIIEILQNR